MVSDIVKKSRMLKFTSFSDKYAEYNGTHKNKHEAAQNASAAVFNFEGIFIPMVNCSSCLKCLTVSDAGIFCFACCG